MDVSGVELHVETMGDPADPALLLLAGMGAPLDWWDDEFCARLAEGGRFVIRYDHRDTGESVSYPVGKPGYTGADLLADALGVLDGLGVRRAHLVGISMGGALAQRIAIHHPDRVESLVLISTTFAFPRDGGPLPPPDARIGAFFAAPPAPPDWSDHPAVVEFIVDMQRLYMTEFDEEAVRKTAQRIVERTRDMAASMVNPRVMADGSAEPAGPPTVPTLVIHGTADPLFPLAHGEALAGAIPGARLLPLSGVGHQTPPPSSWPTVVPAILRHTAESWQARAARLSARSYAAGDPTGWFDQLYAAGEAGDIPLPWDRDAPHPLLESWAHGRDGGGRRAVVVGCGQGADAEYVAGLGYETTAFDVSETAVRLARRRHPHSTVRYTVGDLLDLPAEWLRAFDLVVEVITAQALPDPPRHTAIVNIGRLVAPGGTLIAVEYRQDPAEPDEDGPPFPLERAEIEAFATDGLDVVRIEELADARQPGSRRWRAEFRRRP
jgi:pimeloyl-ACP methyl ester carboxylesterase/SAM-dependent methyltransferase